MCSLVWTHTVLVHETSKRTKTLGPKNIISILGTNLMEKLGQMVYKVIRQLEHIN